MCNLFLNYNIRRYTSERDLQAAARVPLLILPPSPFENRSMPLPDLQLADAGSCNSWGFASLLDQLLERWNVDVLELLDVET